MNNQQPVKTDVYRHQNHRNKFNTKIKFFTVILHSKVLVTKHLGTFSAPAENVVNIGVQFPQLHFFAAVFW